MKYIRKTNEKTRNKFNKELKTVLEICVPSIDYRARSKNTIEFVYCMFICVRGTVKNLRTIKRWKYVILIYNNLYEADTLKIRIESER